MATAVRTTTYAFDPVTGGTTQVTSPEGVLSHAYDPATGRLVRTWTTSNDTTYQYDPQGRLWKLIVTQLNGVTLTTPQATTYAYDAVGNLLTTTQDGGTVTSTDDLVTTDTYDDLNRLDTLTAKRGTTALFDQNYDYESDGQKDKVTEHRGAATTVYDWTYDAINRLTDESYINSGDATKNYAAHYGFDLSSNRVSKTQTGATAATTVNTYNDRDELATTQTNGGPVAVPQYDPDGNTLTDGTNTFTWDLRNRMHTATVPSTNGPVTMTYAYDNDGIRVSKQTGTGPARTFVNDALNPTGYSKPIEEKASGNIDVSYVIGLTVLGQSTPTTGYLSLVQDGQGKTRSVLNLSGVDIQPADYDAYGNTLQPGQTITPWQNPDGYSDFESGLTQQLARSFDRQKGTAVSRDSEIFGIGEWHNANLHLYAGGSPISGSDPSGHLIELIGTIFSGMTRTLGTIRGAIAVHRVAAVTLASLAIVAGAYSTYNFATWKPRAGINCMKYATERYAEINVAAAPKLVGTSITAAQFRSWTTSTLDADEDDYRMYSDFHDDPESGRKVVTAMFGSDAVDQGIAIGANQRKVSLYVYKNPGLGFNYDMHWITQHLDGSWSGKAGPTNAPSLTTPNEELSVRKLNKTYIGTWILNLRPVDKPSN